MRDDVDAVQCVMTLNTPIDLIIEKSVTVVISLPHLL